MAEEALSFLLQQATDVLRDYKDLKDNEKYEFVQLKEELQRLKAFLKDLAKKSTKEAEESFKEKERQIRELVYDVEDTIEVCLTKTAAAKNKNRISRFSQKFSSGMAQEVKLLRERRVKPVIDVIERELIGKKGTTSPRTDVQKDQSMGQPSLTLIHDQSTGQPASDEQSSKQDGVVVIEDEETIIGYQYHNNKGQSMGQPSVTFIHDQSTGQPASDAQSSKQDGVVDFEDEETIIGYLKESKDELDVISITGMPGLGKTTLAWKIFQNQEISRKFPLRIWIDVSQTFRRRAAFLEILEKFKSKDTPSPSDIILSETVRACLAKEEFLLVMDDVWSVEDWNEIVKILPMENKKGKVLVTTRDLNVATQANVFRHPVQQKKLGPVKSLELLKLKVFGNAEACPKELEKIGQAIANKCDGVPLIILVIGGVLKSKFTKNRDIPALKEKWLEVERDVNEILQENVKKTSQYHQDSISNVLGWSYNILHWGLRACFLYTGLFPEKHEIPASTLTQLWIAEGFIQRENGQSFEKNAEEILDTLINMNLLSVGRKTLDQVKTCGVHDMIREFCKSKAMEQNLFRVVKKAKDGVIEPSDSEVPNIRRLCLHSAPSKFLSETPKGPRVRSFLCVFNDPNFDLNPKHTKTILDAFNLLRVLNCKSINFQQFPDVKELFLLKHISLSINNLSVVPKEISQLVNLQTLIVLTKSPSVAVKANIWKMIQLRRLKTKATISLDEKKWKGKVCENLQTISRLSPESCKPELSKRAPCLKTLGIQGKLANLSKTFSFEEFHYLDKLKLVNDLVGKTAFDNLLRALRGHFPPNLKRLTLSKTCLNWTRHMPVVAKINTLKVLKLKNKAFTGVLWEADDRGDFFEQLQFLLIEDSELVIWNASTAYFPSLTWLVLKKCINLRKIPECLAENLDKLEIEGVKKSAAESAKDIESKAKEIGKAKLRAPFELTVGPECDL